MNKTITAKHVLIVTNLERFSPITNLKKFLKRIEIKVLCDKMFCPHLQGTKEEVQPEAKVEINTTSNSRSVNIQGNPMTSI